MEIVRYWWTHDGEEELCIKEEEVLLMPVQCENCSETGTIGSKMIELTPLSANAHAKGYFCVKNVLKKERRRFPDETVLIIENSSDY